jgi:uncharacterized protein
LSDRGYQVKSLKVAADALAELEASTDSPYSLIMSSYMMPKMKGDEILKNARRLSPDTQRLLIAGAAETEILISAINSADINSCLILPFEDENLFVQVRQCCDQYDLNIKKKNLKRTIHRQNKQLFKIASHLKKETTKNVYQIEKKNKAVRILESRIRSAGGSMLPGKPVLLKTILAAHGVSMVPKNFGDAFLQLKNQIKQILETTPSNDHISLKSVSYQEVSGQTPLKKEYKDIAETVQPFVYHLLEKTEMPGVELDNNSREIVLEDHFDLVLLKGKTKALIKTKRDDTYTLSVVHIKQFLEKNKIINGVKVDKKIESWLHQSSPEEDPFLIAQGKEPLYSKNAKIRYHFSTEFLHAGKVNNDGSINFQDRGDVPYVEEDAFLAGKILPEQGTKGIDVYGKEIIVDDPVDLTFSNGSGTRISEDGVRIYATCAGQPHLDAMGNISVCPEYQIKGDLGFETGDVNFDGNVVVNGSVKPGFKIKCASLTAKEIQGAEIDIDGDLNVSLGIIDTELVKVKGSVQAKFVHNSKINSFGDLIIQKEIIDSDIYLSGACINKNGLIVNSRISAKTGISAGIIGNKASKPSFLTVGVDENTNLLVAKVDSKLDINNKAINELKAETNDLDQEHQSLHAVITKYAYTQDRSQLELKDIEKKMENLKASGNIAALQKITKTVEKIQKNAEQAEEEINIGFDRQDAISLEVSQKKGRIKELEDQNKNLLDKKKRLIEFSDRNEALPEVKVGIKIESGTKIFGSNSSLTLINTSHRCRIKEISEQSDGTGGLEFYEMKIIDF